MEAADETGAAMPTRPGAAALGFDDLPPEVQCGVFAHLGVRELGQVVPRVSQSWRQLALTDTLWLHHLRHQYPSVESSTWAKWKGDMAASWRDVFERRFTLDRNWSKQPHLRSLNAHHTLLRALQYDDELCVTCSDFGQNMAIRFWDMKKLLADDFVSSESGSSESELDGGSDDDRVAACRTFATSVHEVLALQFERSRDLLVHSANRSLKYRRLSKPSDVVSDLPAHSGIIWTLQFEGNTLLSGSRDHLIKTWDLETGSNVSTLAGHTRDVRYLRFIGNTAGVWDLRQSLAVAELKTGSANGWACQFDEDKIVCNGNNDVQIWDFRTLMQRQTITAADSVRFLRFDHSKIVVGCQGNIIEVFDLQGKQMNSIHVADHHCGAMTGVLSFQYDERWLFAGLHARPPMNSLYILDFGNPTTSATAAIEK